MNSDCCGPVCNVVQTTTIPGVEGAAGEPGTDGLAGVDAFTQLSAVSPALPAIGAAIALTVLNNAWMGVGQTIFIEGGAHFKVVSKTGLTALSATYLGYSGDLAPGNTLASGALVSPAGTSFDFTGITALTDNTTGAATDTLAAGVGISTLIFPIQLAAMTAAAADLMTDYVVGYAFKILSVDFVTTTIGAGAAATMALNLEIGATNVTGGVATVTLAGTDTLGELTAGTAVTAANIGTATDTLSIEVAAGGTIFTAGSGSLIVKVQNTDTANSAASLAAKINAIIAASP